MSVVSIVGVGVGVGVGEVDGKDPEVMPRAAPASLAKVTAFAERRSNMTTMVIGRRRGGDKRKVIIVTVTSARRAAVLSPPDFLHGCQVRWDERLAASSEKEKHTV